MTTKTTTYRNGTTSIVPVQRDILSESTVPVASVEFRTVSARNLEPRVLPQLGDGWGPPPDGGTQSAHGMRRKT